MHKNSIALILVIITLAIAQSNIINQVEEFDMKKQYLFPLEDGQETCNMKWCIEKCVILVQTYKDYPIAGVRATCSENCLCNLIPGKTVLNMP